MSNDDLGDRTPSGANPLDGDLLGDMTQPLAGSPLMTDDNAATVSAEPAADDGTTAEPAADEAKEKGPGFLARLAESNPSTVMLVASLVALLVGILCLLLEWGSYNFDTKAKEARQSARAAAPLDPAVGPTSMPGSLAV